MLLARERVGGPAGGIQILPDPVERLGWAAAASLATLPVTWFHYPSAMIPFGLAALLRAGPATIGRVRLAIGSALVVAAIAIAIVPLVWVAIALVLVGVRLSGRGDRIGA